MGLCICWLGCLSMLGSLLCYMWLVDNNVIVVDLLVKKVYLLLLLLLFLFFDFNALLYSYDFKWFFLLMNYFPLFLLLQLNLLLPHCYNAINPFWRLWIDPINSQTFGTFYQRTSPMRINNISPTYSTREHTIKWKTLINLITYTTYIHLAISRYGLSECTLVTIYRPLKRYNQLFTSMGCPCGLMNGWDWWWIVMLRYFVVDIVAFSIVVDIVFVKDRSFDYILAS